MDLEDLQELDTEDLKKEENVLAVMLAVIALLVFSVAFSSDPGVPGNEETVNQSGVEDFEPPKPSRNYSSSISVADQPLVNGSFKVNAQNTEPYYIVIHRDESGAPGQILGQSELLAGRVIEKPVRVGDVEGTGFYAVLHGYDGDNTFEPDQDKPIKKGNETVMNTFTRE